MSAIHARASLLRLDLLLAVVLAPFACTPDPIPDLEQSETGGEEVVEPLPGGAACEANWFAHDGPPVPAELEPVDISLATHLGEIAFTGAPPRQASHPAPSPVDPSFADMDFQTFTQTHAKPAGAGEWLVEGDHGMSETQLRALHASLRDRARREGNGPRSAAWSPDGVDATWSAEEKLSLTWCLGTIGPPPQNDPEAHAERVALAIATMEWATRAWERAADVNFIHLHELDAPGSSTSGMCKPGQNGVDIRVRTGFECTSSCGGLVFSPATPQEEFTDPEEQVAKAELILGFQRFFWSEHEARINALHELGHVLGFAHEHQRWEQDSGCVDNPQIPWRGLTPRDPDSIMGTDTCEGINLNQPRLSAWDRLGAYYAYNWGRRRARLPGAASTVDEFAYEGERRAGVAWQRTRSPDLELWQATSGVGQVIEFGARSVCVGGGAPPCPESFDALGRVRGFNARMSGDATALDLLFNGPGAAIEDLLLLNQSGAFAPLELNLDEHTIPVVGSFGAGSRDQVLLYRPGPDSDALLVLEDEGLSLLAVNYSGYAYPLAAPYRGAAGKSDILWYEPREGEFNLWLWTGDEQFSFVALGLGDPAELAINVGTAYIPIVGDFNGDERADIFWYAAGPPADIMWWSTSPPDGVLFSPAQTSLDGEYRPFVGDFDGNGVSDILWFASYGEAVQASSMIWYFDEDEGFAERTLSTNGDYSPYVADFDGDGCSDILWHQPHDSERQALLWRCLPGQRDFDCDPPTATPERGYPIGFGGHY